jgi:hypothetical protein
MTASSDIGASFSWPNEELHLYLTNIKAAWTAGRLPSRRVPAMIGTTQRSSSARRAVGVLTLALGTLWLGGCSFSSTGREAYFAARADSVMFAKGSGEVRLSVWPDSPFNDDMALAERSDPVSRWTDRGE